MLLCDADDGSVLAVMDSIEITLRRTAAASALAARYLAREDANSSRSADAASKDARNSPRLAEVAAAQAAYAYGIIDPGKAERIRSRRCTTALGLDVTALFRHAAMRRDRATSS